jgi:N-hydroxyarylamine O-acetyltransferase
MLMDHQAVVAYLNRVGVTAPTAGDAAGLRTLHRAHQRAVPFENLSIHLAEPISLDERDLIAKIVSRRRGGFCYELNGAFALLLEALGAQVSRVAARVYGQAGLGPPFAHLALIVRLADGSGPWLADVGFGSHSDYPLLLEARDDQDDPAGRFRLADAGQGDIDVLKDGQPQYRIEMRERSLADCVPTCWWQQTSPLSHFTRSTICSRLTPGGRVSISGRMLIQTQGGTRTEQQLDTDEALLAAYRDHFGIVLSRVPDDPAREAGGAGELVPLDGTHGCCVPVQPGTHRAVGGGLDRQSRRAGDDVRHLRYGRVVGVDMLGELGPVKLLQPLVQDLGLPGLGSRLPAEAAGAQSPYHGRGLGQQREVVQLDAVVAQAADDLLEVAGVQQRHRGDHRPAMAGQRHAQQFQHGVPPGGDVLPEAVPQRRGQHAAHAVADVRGVADHAAGQPPVQLEGGRGLAHPAGAIDPQEHRGARERTAVAGGLVLPDDLAPGGAIRLTSIRHAHARCCLDLVVRHRALRPVARSRRLATAG